MTKILYSYRDLTERWGISYRTLCRLAASGEIKTCKIGRSVRVHIDEVEQFEIKRKVKWNG
jgi:excisionase family DNA binding protein